MKPSRRLVLLRDRTCILPELSAILFALAPEAFTEVVAPEVNVVIANATAHADAVVLLFETVEETLLHASLIRRPIVAISDRANAQALRDAGIGVVVTLDDIAKSVIDQAVDFAMERHGLIKELNDARHDLERIKQDYPLLPKNAPEIIARVDRNFRHLYVNEAVVSATGLSTEHFLGKTNRELGMPEEICAFWEAKISETMVTRGHVSYEFEYPSPSGPRYFLARLAPELDSVGEVISVLSIATDITERKIFEDQLNRSEKLFRATFDNAAVGIAHVDLEGHWIRVNDRLCEIVGYKRQELLTGTFQQVTHPDDLAKDLAMVERLLSREISNYSLEKRYIRQNGEVVWVTLTVSLFLDENDQAASFLSIVEDITNRKNTEEALRRSESGRDLALQAGRMGVWDWDKPSGRLNWSSTLEEIYGYLPGEFPGRDEAYFALIHPDDISELQASIDRAFAKGPDFQSAFRARHRDGTFHWFAGQGQVLYDTNQEPSGLTGVSWDITETRLTQESLKEADRRKNEFLAMLAHELRNPLAAIRNAANLLKVRPSSDPDVRWSHNVISRQTVHLNRLVDDLLDVSRITQGKIPLQRSCIDLRDVIERTVDDMHSLILEKNLHLEVILPGAPLPLLGDPQRLEQVIANLLTNASKYTDNGGLIQLQAALRGAEISVTIRDNGVGISPEMLASIFGLFVQVDNTLDRSQGGLGIGLTLVKMLTELHGGTVAAFSEGLGKGSMFEIRLPAISTEEAAAFVPAHGSDSSAPTATPPSRRIVLVDDNTDSARGLARLLRLRGHEVVVAHDGHEGLSIALNSRPDVFLLDIGLPGMNGYDLVRELKQNPAFDEALFIAVSGYSPGKDFDRSAEVGFDHYLVKPIDFDVLIELLGNKSMLS